MGRSLESENDRSIDLEYSKFVKNPTSGAIEHVEWTEGISKTRQDGLHKPGGTVAQKAFAIRWPEVAHCSTGEDDLQAATFRILAHVYLQPPNVHVAICVVDSYM